MQGLDFQGWFDMLEVVFTNVLQMLKRMKILHHSFLNVLAIAAGQDRTGSWSVQDSSVESYDILISAAQCGKLTNESKEILGGAGEMAQARCVKLINVRAKAGYLDALASTEFVCLSRSVEKFVSECEAVCGRHSRVLRTILVTQAKKFVERFHEEKKQKLSLILDNERWKQADVPAEFQTLVDSLVDGVPTSEREILSLPSNKQASSLSSSRKPPASHLVVNGEKFAVAGTLLLVLNMIVEYCHCVDLMPMLAADIMTKLFELMKMFNSRTCQLVLGAGALQLVGLKTITAKHLALASRCLEVVTLHIATFKSHFELRLPPKQYVLLGQFDQILKDYNNHRQEIFSKMATLMEELFDDHLLTWEVRPPMPSQVMRNIVKQITKLHEALLAIFPATQVEIVMKDVKKSFKNVLAKKIASLKVKNDFGPQHGLVQSDLAYFAMNLKSLHGMKDVEDSLGDIWKLANELRTSKPLPTMNKKALPNR
ncbi:vacuolar sorting-associated 54-like [Paramuricea clavata]|uniref:Vacuolar sorting-associated 54-like n=2 Tax=Paramuricea clavata TaxID=317549 RepID=A0A6S7HYZ9_PARCT|nr:vacuolar sorting-associated 54-like [Paramuricea clavata]